MLFGDFLNPGDCFKLALVPIPGTIRLPESAEFRRKATLLRRIAVLVFPAGKAARELGLERILFMELLKRRGIPYVIYTAEDWERDADALQEFEKRRKNR